ncbi:MAG: hypothetical protein JNM36_18740 [Chitinophagales bacterium]|jgi:hypothetical protein|nr:hypothetical protein [Chitinophagales bacterium]HNI45178.1 hypothetical protein [Chitinophagales bacterium]HNL06412.1 hypothetical protein [Chitinophagales bacterium]
MSYFKIVLAQYTCQFLLGVSDFVINIRALDNHHYLSTRYSGLSPNIVLQNTIS